MRRAALAVIALALSGVAAAASSWEVPAPGSCERQPPILMSPPPDWDAPPLSLPKPGETLSNENAERLRYLLPPELWEKRDRFLFDGMQMEIGPCYRDYSPPPFFVEATEKLHGAVTLSGDGTLAGYKAGLPFPPETIAADDPHAGLKWAWNRVYRWQGAGRFGKTLWSIVDDKGIAGQWQGESFLLQIRGRADRPGDDYVYPAQMDAVWAAGGETKNLTTGNTCVFRQYDAGGRKPELFMGSSESRKIDRVPPPDSELPLTSCVTEAAIGAGLFLHGATPYLHEWKVRGVFDLLAPINSAKNTWPVDRNRGYGPWGISFADDRWEQRRVLVLEGKLHEGEQPFEDGTLRFVWYLDLQTLMPLYYAAYRKSGAASGVGYFVWRWSEDRKDYPRWSDDAERPVRVLDLVGEAMVDWNDQHAVRLERGDTVAIPKDDAKLRRGLSTGSVRLH